MKISSKSILSPGRTGVRDPPTTLSTSLSRRLKNSGSVKGGASPAMFPTAAKKRGTFENPEPSSPKVTCIGQVRVRGKKKQAKKLRTLSRRHSSGPSGEVSFRKLEHPVNGFCSKDQNHKESLNLGPKGGQNHNQSYHQNQNQECSPVQRSWVHFPVTVCEALRAFGSEFSCLIPCRTERGKEEKTVAVGDGNRQGSCGVFARWLMAVQDGEGGGERDIELVVGDEVEEEEEEEFVGRKTRRHVFEDLEIVNGRIEGHKDEARVSICVPPKNALLLMRCRSDPMKSEALGSRSWEPSVGRNEEEDEEFVDGINRIENDSKKGQAFLEVKQQEVMVVDQDQENVQVEAKLYQEQRNVQQDDDNVDQDEANQDQEIDNVQVGQDQELDNVQYYEVGQGQELNNVQQEVVGQDQELDNVQNYEVGQDQELDNVQNYEVGQEQELDGVQQYEVGQDQEHDNVQQYEVGEEDQEYEQTEVEESFYLVSLFEEIMNQDYEVQEQDEAHEEDVAENGVEESTMVAAFADMSETHEEEMINEVEEHNNGVLEGENEVKEKRGSEVLPECLLMMMHEPKLSLNVSKETWVCSTDFIRHRSNRRKPPAPPPPIKPNSGDDTSAGATATVKDVMMVGDEGLPTVLQHPARSSCSLPVAPSLLEQKLVNAVGYEPFVLTRCKSEPMKTATSKLLPESCVWENRKLERLTFGVGAAGLGF